MNNPYSAPQGDVNENINNFDEVDNLASRGSRFAAALLDALIGAMATIPTYLYKIYILKHEWNSLESFEYQAGMFIYSAAMFLAINGYLLTKSGQTCGKKILKIKVATVYYTKPSLFSLTVIRTYLIWIISYIPWMAMVSLIDVLFIFRHNRRCIHDYMAKTIVIKDTIKFNAE